MLQAEFVATFHDGTASSHGNPVSQTGDSQRDEAVFVWCVQPDNDSTRIIRTGGVGSLAAPIPDSTPNCNTTATAIARCRNARPGRSFPGCRETNNRALEQSRFMAVALARRSSSSARPILPRISPTPRFESETSDRFWSVEIRPPPNSRRGMHVAGKTRDQRWGR